MKSIDADAHIEECDATFSDKYLEPAFRPRRPQAIPGSLGQAFWLIDDAVYPRRHGPGCNNLGTPTSIGGEPTPFTKSKPEGIDSLELRDRKARIADMQAEGIDVQVLYPTLFLAYPLTSDPAFEAALYRAYNSWMCDACGDDERLRWAGVVPLSNVPAAVAEVKRLKNDLKADGIMVLGSAGNDMHDHERLLPFWEEVSNQDMPVAVHVGWACPQLSNLFDTLYPSTVMGFLFPVLMAFAAFCGGGLLDRFANLRVAFLEAGCEWIHFMSARLDHRYAFINKLSEILPITKPKSQQPASEYLKTGRLFFNAEVDDGLLPQVIDLVGENQILFASDMPHSDRDRYAVKELRARDDIPPTSADKILFDNPMRFYGWS